MSLIAKFFDQFRLDEDRVLVEQLQVMLRNYSTAALPLALLVLLIYWALLATVNAQSMLLWSVLAFSSTSYFYLFARSHLRTEIPLSEARKLAWQCIVLRGIDGALWGALVWVAFDASSIAGKILIFASIASMAGGAVSTLSPVLWVFLAYLVPLLGLMSIKLWLTGDAGYEAVGWAGVLYFFAMLSQGLNTTRAVNSTIKLRFDLSESNRQLREIEKQQALADERKRLVQDMHDGLGSSLVSALRVVEHGRLSEIAVAEVLKGCIDDLKLAIDSMETAEADLLLLLATLRFRLGPRLESTGIKLKWEVGAVPEMTWIDSRNALHILRILQEALTNIIKHTHASQIHFATSVHENRVVVSITDDGQGFRVEEAMKNGGKGLSNQIRRAQSIGAEVGWQSGEAGTRFMLHLPILRSKTT